MPRRAEDREFVLPLRGDHISLQRWLYSELRGAILNGRLAPGTRLPSTRDLAQQYGVARGTVSIAYDQLAAEGYLSACVGSGTFVEHRLPDSLVRGNGERTRSSPATDKRADAIRLSDFGGALAQKEFPLSGRRRLEAAFRVGQPDLVNFPVDVWARVAARRIRAAERLLLADGDARGYEPLRREIACRLGSARGITCSADEIVIVSSVQQALDLVARLLIEPGKSAWVEEPGYPPARRLLEAAGARVVNIPVDARGIDPEIGLRRGRGARLVLITPTRQAPLGMALSLERRLALLRLAEECDGFIFEDDYDGEFRFRDRPLAALKALDHGDRVIYAGTFSKVLFPALRLAYVVLPHALASPFVTAWSSTSRHAPVLNQSILYDFMAEGHFGRHVRHMRQLYASRLETLDAAARAYWSGMLRLMPHDAGLDVAAIACERQLDDISLSARAVDAGLEIMPLSPWFAKKSTRLPGVVLGFAAVRENEIRKAAQLLGRLLRDLKLGR